MKRTNSILILILACAAAQAQSDNFSYLLLQNWPQVEHPNNPVFIATGSETGKCRGVQSYGEFYTAMPWANGSDLYAYLKETNHISLCKSTDNGNTWAFEGVALRPGDSGQWDDGNVVEPTLFIDPATSTGHLYYKGCHSLSPPNCTPVGWGHATFSLSTPLTLTKDSANPIKTMANVQSEAGFGSETVYDSGINEVIKIGSTIRFYGYAYSSTSSKIWRADATTWNNPVINGQIFNTLVNGRFSAMCSVFQFPGATDLMGFFVDGSVGITPDPTVWRGISIAVSKDNGETFTKIEPQGSILQPTGLSSGWYSRMVHHLRLLKDSTDPNNLKPLPVDGKYQIYFSGIDDTATLAQVGILYLIPGIGHDAPVSVPCTSGVNPAVRLRNGFGIADAGIGCADYPDGIVVQFSTNMALYPPGGIIQGTISPRYDTTRPAVGIRLEKEGVFKVLATRADGTQTIPLIAGPAGVLISKDGVGSQTPPAFFNVVAPTTAFGTIFDLRAAGVAGLSMKLLSTTAFPFWDYSFYNGSLKLPHGDLLINTSTKGLIQKSADGTCHRLSISNTNVITASTVACP